MTSCLVQSMSLQWFGRSKVKLRVHVVWFAQPRHLELLFCSTRKTTCRLPTGSSHAAFSEGLSMLLQSDVPLRTENVSYVEISISWRPKQSEGFNECCLTQSMHRKLTLVYSGPGLMWTWFWFWSNLILASFHTGLMWSWCKLILV